MQTSPEAFESPERYRGFLALASHELFHVWNIKRFRPAGLARYDYQRENLTPSLWVVEGTTSYYDGLMLVRAGVMTPAQYFERLSGSIQSSLARPGRAVQSLSEASMDAWIEFNKPSPDRENTSVNFYGQGSLASLVLDAEIRARSGGAASLDDVMRALNDGFGPGSPGYTPLDIVRLASEAAGSDMSDVFARVVDGTEEIDYQRVLALYGLTLEFELSRTAWEKERDAEPRGTRPDLGLKTTVEGGGARISAVLTTGPAFEAGLMAGDEIVAINSQRVRNGDLNAVLESVEPDASVVVTFFRRDELRSIALRPRQVAHGTWKISIADDATEAQRAMLEAWLGAGSAELLRSEPIEDD
jgi:predicted metalloprotease with PDZ domain